MPGHYKSTKQSGPKAGDRAGPSKQDKVPSRTQQRIKSKKPTPFSEDYPKVTIGYGPRQVDPGLAAANLYVSNRDSTKPMTLQQAQQEVQQAMGSTGVGFGIGSLPPVAATTPIVKDEDDKENIFDKAINKVKKAPGILQNLASQWGGPIPFLLINDIYLLMS